MRLLKYLLLLITLLEQASSFSYTLGKQAQYIFYSIRFEGAILRQHEDSHIRAALNFAVHWINNHRPDFGRFELKVESIQPGDHYGAILKGTQRLQWKYHINL